MYRPRSSAHVISSNKPFAFSLKEPSSPSPLISKRQTSQGRPLLISSLATNPVVRKLTRKSSYYDPGHRWIMKVKRIVKIDARQTLSYKRGWKSPRMGRYAYRGKLIVHVGKADPVIREGVCVLHGGILLLAAAAAVPIGFGCQVVRQVPIRAVVGRKLLRNRLRMRLHPSINSRNSL